MTTPRKLDLIKQKTTPMSTPKSYGSIGRLVARGPLSSADWNTWSEAARGGLVAGAVILFVFLVAIVIYAIIERKKATGSRRKGGGDNANSGRHRSRNRKSRGAEERPSRIWEQRGKGEGEEG